MGSHPICGKGSDVVVAAGNYEKGAPSQLESDQRIPTGSGSCESLQAAMIDVVLPCAAIHDKWWARKWRREEGRAHSSRYQTLRM